MSRSDAHQQPDAPACADTDAPAPEADPPTHRSLLSARPLSRRRLLAAGGVVGLAGLAGCQDTVDDLLGRVSEEAVTTTGATPAAFYGGTGASAAGDRPARHPIAATELEYVPLSVSVERAGRSQDVALDGWFVDATVRAQNHNSSRSNRSSGVAWRDPEDDDADDDGLSTADEALYAYLDGDAVIGERCVLAVPDVRVRGSEALLAAETTPARLLEYLTTAPEDTESATSDDGVVYAWGDRQPRFAADITLPERARYDPWSQLVALGYNGDVNNSTIINMPRSAATASGSGGGDDATDGDDPANWHVTSNGDLRRFDSRELRKWGEERTVGDIAVTSTIVGSVQAQPADCPSPMPALLQLRRIRHDDQCLYVCGWTIDDGALYDNSFTMLVAKDVNELVHVEYGEVDAMRRAIESGFTRERSRLGAMVYDGELGREALAFLPAKLRADPGLSDLLERTTADLGDRAADVTIPLREDASGSTATLHCTIAALDAPVVHLARDGCEEPPYCANQIPATNTIPSR